MYKFFFRFVLIVCLSFTILGCSDKVKEDNNIFRITAIPDENPTELARKSKPLMDYLSSLIERPVVFYPVTDYSAAVEALVNKKVDMAWFGGFTFVQANNRSDGKVIPIIQRIEDKSFRSVFITSDPSIKTLTDLKGKEVSFGSVNSTSGHLMPRTFLLKEGIDPDKDFKKVAFSGAHDATIFSVSSGKVQAGALNIKVWEKFVKESKVPEGVNVFYETPEYFDYNWTVHDGVPIEIRDVIIEGFLSLSNKTEQGKEILKLQGASGFIKTNASNYLGIEEAAKSAGLLK
jgi:phosphonate transport system substrate-binding protein